ncbi:HlyD family secretion protein [Stutzerimonas kunmingensis]|uniref:HlyD family secretion protein n=1 Tax=Stutzerimonas kunmingensis TaxID=1211807 RepID=A0A9X1N0D8_9GAMM|nr:HlyD family secretion protein [Stutzerimonas kunmingensis]MCD1606404.1 HlyD family secretion protein [Stutzerimonas kunmingensis]PNG01277.1 hemolysin secretion protein D [Stutzerimonas kunmingensis]
MTDKKKPREDLPAAPVVEESAAPADAGPVESEPPKTIRPRARTVVLMLGVALVGILAILYAWRLPPFTSGIVTTENAYVRGQITVLAPQVNGYVSEALVEDFQAVEQGQALIRIDDRIYRQKVAQARAELAARQFELDNVVQALASDQATLASRRAEIGAAKAEFDRARADELRVNELSERGSVSVRERDQIRATARSAAANVKRSEAAIQIAEESLKATGVSKGGLQAQVALAEASLRLAEIDLANTLIKAPRGGQVSQVTVRLGQYVSAGSQLLYLVPRQLWIIANYKETQIHHMRVGQPVTFDIDALDGATLTGRVERLAPATGSEFSVLAPDNATGNFTKVVQRLPVRIAINAEQPLAERLRPGLSVVVHVDTSADDEEGVQ